MKLPQKCANFCFDDFSVDFLFDDFHGKITRVGFSLALKNLTKVWNLMYGI